MSLMVCLSQSLLPITFTRPMSFQFATNCHTSSGEKVPSRLICSMGRLKTLALSNCLSNISAHPSSSTFLIYACV